MKKLTSNFIYHHFSDSIDTFRKQLASKINDVGEYRSNILLDRLMQRLSEVGLPAYTLEVHRQRELIGSGLAPSIDQVHCPFVTLHTQTGAITFTFSQLVRNQFDFIAHWLICLLALVFPACNDENAGHTSLLFGVGGESLFGMNGDEEFVRFCKEGPIEFLNKCKRIIVQSAVRCPKECQSIFHYSRQPVLSLLRKSTIGFNARVAAVFSHIKLLFSYFKITLRDPELSLLGRDFAYSSAISSFDQAKAIDAIIFTNSNFLRQPLWSRTLRNAFSCMVWNSQNFKPILYENDLRASHVPGVRWIRVDRHLVWTKAFADYLKSLGLSNIEKIDPILWYLPKTKPANSSSIKITVFDISPYSDVTALFYGEIPNYNGPKNLFLFIRDIVNLKTHLKNIFGVSVLLIVKSKRGYNSAYDLAYFKYLKDLEARGIIKVEHHAENMFSLISGSDLSIVYPFSSPAYVADYVGVPSIYYDPTGSIVQHHFGDTGSLIKFSNTSDNLISTTLELLKIGANKNKLM